MMKCSFPNKTKRLKNETTNAFPVRHRDNFRQTPFIISRNDVQDYIINWGKDLNLASYVMTTVLPTFTN